MTDDKLYFQGPPQSPGFLKTRAGGAYRDMATRSELDEPLPFWLRIGPTPWLSKADDPRPNGGCQCENPEDEEEV